MTGASREDPAILATHTRALAAGIEEWTKKEKITTDIVRGRSERSGVGGVGRDRVGERISPLSP